MSSELVYDEVIDRGIIYEFIPYEFPRLAEYSFDINVYEYPKGWLTEPKQVLVIGEAKDSYTTELKSSSHGEWDEKRILLKYILPLGFHKSRLIRWVDTQLTLF